MINFSLCQTKMACVGGGGRGGAYKSAGERLRKPRNSHQLEVFRQSCFHFWKDITLNNKYILATLVFNLLLLCCFLPQLQLFHRFEQWIPITNCLRRSSCVQRTFYSLLSRWKGKFPYMFCPYTQLNSINYI